ncbi:unnamed protein product [Owenia fusiformis]|uniref:Uncharacterized protein n=1 Tax=Owenia fusiformis TaxID=6347 RepID=A0A8J1TFA7_OWEFU|nr:unnamed protein product [Owenia fusiformis]
MLVKEVVTQGRSGSNQWVNSYKVYYGNDDNNLQEYGTILQGNSDDDTKVTNQLNPPLEAKYVRINPQTCNNHCSMRFDVIGCPIANQVVCTEQLISGRVYHINDSSLTASSEYGANYRASYSRLDTFQSAGGWVAPTNDDEQWIQVDLDEVMLVRGIVTQGRNQATQWVTSYNMFYGISIGNLHRYHMTLQGNSDPDTEVTNMLDPPVVTRYVRINPQTRHQHNTLRFDVIGCPLVKPENVGAWVNVTLARPYWVKEVSLIQNRESLLTQASKVKMDFSDGSSKEIGLFDMKPDDQHSREAVRFDSPVLSNWVKIIFVDAYLKSMESFGIVELDIIADFGHLTNQAALSGTATSSSEFNVDMAVENTIDGTLVKYFGFALNTWEDQWVSITLEAEHWVHVVKYANRCEMNSEHRSVVVKFFNAMPSLIWESSVGSQVYMYKDIEDCRSFRWTTIPLTHTRLVKSVKFTVKQMWLNEGTTLTTGMSEIQIFTGRNLVGSSSPIMDETFPGEIRSLIHTLTDMEKSPCSFEVQNVPRGRFVFLTNAIGLTQFKLVITTNGGAADDFHVYSTSDTTTDIASARMLRCTGPDYPGTGEFAWTCTADEGEGSLYAAMIVVSTSSMYKLCEIELLAGPDS